MSLTYRNDASLAKGLSSILQCHGVEKSILTDSVSKLSQIMLAVFCKEIQIA